MTIGSLFAGIGGLELGLEWAGVGHTVWQVESNPYCRSVLHTRWPNARRFDDVRDVGIRNLPPVDVLCGGFPCQDISNAGKRAGIGGERSGLWSEFARIIREMGPSYVVVENVSALLVRGLDRVLGDLAAAGYDAEWDVLSAADVGAPHLRRRVFLIAWRADTECEGQPQSQGRFGDERGWVGDVGAEVAYAEVLTRRASSDESPQLWRGQSGDGSCPRRNGGTRRAGSGDWWATEPDVGRVAHGVPARVDRLRALGNAVVPQCAEVVGRRLLEIAAELQSEEA